MLVGGQCPRLGSWRIQWGCADELSVTLVRRGTAQLQRPAVIGSLWLHRCGSQTLSRELGGAVG